MVIASAGREAGTSFPAEGPTSAQTNDWIALQKNCRSCSNGRISSSSEGSLMAFWITGERSLLEEKGSMIMVRGRMRRRRGKLSGGRQRTRQTY